MNLVTVAALILTVKREREGEGGREGGREGERERERGE